MPKFFNQSKHEEFELKSALQIRNQKERRAEKAGKLSSFVEGCEIFAQCEKAYAFFFLIFFPFDRLTSFFFFFQFYPSCIMGIEDIFVFLLI